MLTFRDHHFNKNLKSPQAHLRTSVFLPGQTLATLRSLVETVQTERLRSGPLLDYVFAQRVCLDSPIAEIQKRVGLVFVRQLASWCLFGLLWDPFGEFFIAESGDDSEGAGGPPAEEGLLGGGLGASSTGGVVDGGSLKAALRPRDARREWLGRFCLLEERVPRLCYDSADRVLRAGKSVRALALSGRELTEREIEDGRAALGEVMGLWGGGGQGTVGTACSVVSSAERDSREERTSDRAEERPAAEKPPHWVMERALEKINSVVAGRLCALILDESQLARHLISMKGFFCCAHGPFFTSFLERASELLMQPPSSFAESEIEGAWRWALTSHPEVSSDFALRLMPAGFVHQGFLDAGEAVSYFPTGGARLLSAEGSGSLEMGGEAMAWHVAAQQFGNAGFRHAMTFQCAGAGTSSVRGGGGAKKNSVFSDGASRFVVLFQHGVEPGEIQRRARIREEAGSLEWETSGWGGSSAEGGAAGFFPHHQDGGGRGGGTSLYEAAEGGEDEEPCLGVWWEVLLASALVLEVVVARNAPERSALRLAVKNGARYKLLAEKEGVSFLEKNYLELEHDGNGGLAVNLNSRSVLDAKFDPFSHLDLELGCCYVGLATVPVGRVAPSAASPDEREDLDFGRDSKIQILTWKHVLKTTSPAAQLAEAETPALAAFQRTPPSAATAKALTPSAADYSSDAWHRLLAIAFTPPWPCSLVLTDEDLHGYNRVFRLIFAFKRAQYGLSRLFLVSKTSRGSFFAAKLGYFVREILHYLQHDAVEVRFDKMLRRIVSRPSSSDGGGAGGAAGAPAARGASFDTLVLAHQQFLQSLVSDCFLETPAVLKCLTAVVSICWRFIRVISAAGEARPAMIAGRSAGGRGGLNQGRAQASAMEAQLLAKLGKEFESVQQDLLLYLAKLQASAPELQSLLLRLNFNGFFSGVAGG